MKTTLCITLGLCILALCSGCQVPNRRSVEAFILTYERSNLRYNAEYKPQYLHSYPTIHTISDFEAAIADYEKESLRTYIDLGGYPGSEWGKSKANPRNWRGPYQKEDFYYRILYIADDGFHWDASLVYAIKGKADLYIVYWPNIIFPSQGVRF